MNRVDTALAWLLGLLGAAGAAVSAWAIPRAGIGWDAGIDTYAAIDVRGIPAGSSLNEAYESVYSTSEFYGVLVQWAGDLLGVLAGGSAPLSPSSASTYQLQAAVTLVLVVAGTAVAAWTVAYLLNSRIAGLFVWAAALTVPLMVGLSVVDFKDSPIAAALLMVSSGASLLWVRRSSSILTAGTLFIAAGTFIGLGVRIGSWPLIGAIIVASLIASILWALLARGRVSVMRTVLAPAAGVGLGLVGIVILHPIARIDLPRWAFDAFAISRSYPWVGTIRTLGRDLPSSELPWWYLPVWFAALMPILFSILIAAGVLFWFISVGQALRKIRVNSDERASGANADPPGAVTLLPFAVQAVVLPIGLVVLGATLYDGIRHVAFAIPALVVLSAPMVAAAVSGSDTRSITRERLRLGVVILVVAVPIANLIGAIRWFPYMYAHVNVVVASLDSGRDWEYDYWGTTVIEGANRLRELGATDVVVSPSIDARGIAEVAQLIPADRLEHGQEYGLYVFYRYDAQIPDDECERVFTIARGGITLGEGALCEVASRAKSEG